MNSTQFSLLGYPLGHSMSPYIHQELFNLSGLKGRYSLLEISPEQLPQGVHELKKSGGFNVTIPYKQKIIPYLDRLEGKAELYGSVNTVKTAEDHCAGYNTDCIGFLNSLALYDIPLCGNVLVCGCGGVARMAVFESALAGCSVTIAVRTAQQDPAELPAAEQLAVEAAQKIPGSHVTCTTYDRAGTGYDLIINGTPAGMFPHADSMAPTEATVAGSKAVFDCVYNPEMTLLLGTAKKYGRRYAGGMAMLVLQAAAAQTIWYGAEFQKDDLLAVIARTQAELEKKNG